MTRVLAIDLGSVRVGLALSDPSGVLAQPLEVVARAHAEGTIADRARDLDVTEIVVGIPLRMDGSRGPEADDAAAFAEGIGARTGLPVTLFDERLSTVQAERAMRSSGTDARGQRGVVDKVAAALVLQAFLDSRRSA